MLNLFSNLSFLIWILFPPPYGKGCLLNLTRGRDRRGIEWLARFTNFIVYYTCVVRRCEEFILKSLLEKKKLSLLHPTPSPPTIKRPQNLIVTNYLIHSSTPSPLNTTVLSQPCPPLSNRLISKTPRLLQLAESCTNRAK